MRWRGNPSPKPRAQGFYHWQKPYFREMLSAARKGNFLDKVTAHALAERHGVQVRVIWRTYYKIRRDYPYLFPKFSGKGRFGRKKLTRVVRFRPLIRTLLLKLRGGGKIELPTGRLAEELNLTSATIRAEANRVRNELRREGHKIGEFKRGGNHAMAARLLQRK